MFMNVIWSIIIAFVFNGNIWAIAKYVVVGGLLKPVYTEQRVVPS
jgi:hypothetical protein